MSFDFSNEPIGKPRWCITRGGEIRLAWRCETDDSYPVVAFSDLGRIDTLTYCGVEVIGESGKDDLVSFAPPECDSFTWKAPEQFQIGDWVECVQDTLTIRVGEKHQVSAVARGVILLAKKETWLDASKFRKCDPPIQVGDWVEVVDAQGHREHPRFKLGMICKVTSLEGSCAFLNNHWDPCDISRLRKCDPPSPTYRPFANAEEFLPHATRWIEAKESDEKHLVRCSELTNRGIFGGVSRDFFKWDRLLAKCVFADTNEPCGVKVQ